MAMKLYSDTSVQNIANAIRTKNGTATTYKVNEMSIAVSSLQCLHENEQTQNPLNIKGIGCLKDYKVYGNATQSGTPTPSNPIEITSVGTLVQSGEYAGKYKIDVVSTANTSEPYHTPIITPIYLDKPLYKIGNVSDYIDFGNKKVVRGIGEVVLNGSETGWNQRASGVNCYRGYRIPNCRAVWATKNSYTNYFDYNVDNAYNGRNGYGIDGNAQILIGIDNVSTVNDFKTWLSTHNTKVVYELTSPVEESISLPDIPLFNDIHTIVEVDNATGMYGKYWEVL